MLWRVSASRSFYSITWTYILFHLIEIFCFVAFLVSTFLTTMINVAMNICGLVSRWIYDTNFFTPLPTLVIFHFYCHYYYYYHHVILMGVTSGGEVVSHYDFYLYLPNDWWCWPSCPIFIIHSYIFWRNVYSNLLSVFKFGHLFF